MTGRVKYASSGCIFTIHAQSAVEETMIIQHISALSWSHVFCLLLAMQDGEHRLFCGVNYMQRITLLHTKQLIKVVVEQFAISEFYIVGELVSLQTWQVVTRIRLDIPDNLVLGDVLDKAGACLPMFVAVNLSRLPPFVAGQT